jgi:hypothetical protein
MGIGGLRIVAYFPDQTPVIRHPCCSYRLSRIVSALRRCNHPSHPSFRFEFSNLIIGQKEKIFCPLQPPTIKLLFSKAASSSNHLGNLPASQ